MARTPVLPEASPVRAVPALSGRHRNSRLGFDPRAAKPVYGFVTASGLRAG